jgi:hypothetical protein
MANHGESYEKNAVRKECRTTQVRHSARERRPAWNNDVVEHITIKTATAGRCCLDLLVRRIEAYSHLVFRR